MTNIMKIQIIDAVTKESEIRPFTEEEIIIHEQLGLPTESIESISLSRESARQSALAKLAALGLTEEEIAAL